MSVVTSAPRAALAFVLLSLAGARVLDGCGADDGSGPPTDATPEGGGTPPPQPPGPPAGDAGDDGPSDDGARPPVPGLDPAFGNGGFANVNIGSGGDVATFVFRQSDGKIVAAGNATGLTNDFIAVRLDATGKLDPTYGDGGRVQIDVPHEMNQTYIMHAAIGPDDKLVISTGLARPGSGPFGRMYRLDTKGALDATFGTGGHVNTPTTTANVVTVLANGSILFAGAFASDFVVRYTSSGAIDATFGTAGVVTLTGKYDYPTDLTIAPSGKIVLGGYYNGGGGSWLYTATRLGADGSVDGTFGTSGRATATLPTGFLPFSLAVQADEKVLLAGGSGVDGALVRFDALGNLDTTLDGDGVLDVAGATLHGLAVTTDGHIVSADDKGAIHRWASNGTTDAPIAVASSSFRDVRVASDGTILAAGRTVAPTPGLHITQVAAAGSVDWSLTTAFAGSDEQSGDAVVLPSGAIVAIAAIPYAARLVGFTAAGQLDSTFGTNGTLSVSASSVVPTCIGTDAAGRLVAAGGSNSTAKVWRFAPNGTADMMFGSNGSANVTNGAYVRALATHPNGSTYLVGQSSGAGAMLWSTSPDGNSSASVSFGGSSAQAYAVAVQADGKLVVGGYSYASSADVLLARFDSALAMDTTFGGGGDGGTDAGVPGIVKLALSPADDVARGVTIAPDGKILVVGSSSSLGGSVAYEWNGTSTMFVARFDTSGQLDPTFGTGGIANPDAGGQAYAYAARVQADGTILVAGRRRSGEREDAVLLKLTSAGALDTSYATGGVRTLVIGNESGLRTLALLPDGKPLASGYVHVGPGAEDVAIFRFVP